jgi:hypothetical protein
MWSKKVENHRECHYSEIHINAKIDFDIFLITLQLTTFRHREKPKTIL